MIPDTNLDFIRARIYDIRTALLYSMSEKLVKIPNSLISVLKVDDKGQIWFVMNKPTIAMEKSEQHFPARLHFYRKGKPYYMQVTGDARFVEERAALGHLFSVPRTINKLASNNLVVVKLKIKAVEYHEPEVRKPKNSIAKMLQYLYSSLFVPNHSYQVLYDEQLNKWIPAPNMQRSAYN